MNHNLLISLNYLSFRLSEKNAALSSRTADLDEYVRRLEHLVKEYRHALYGKGSEKLTADQRQLAFEDIEVAVAEVEDTGDCEEGKKTLWESFPDERPGAGCIIPEAPSRQT